MLEKLKKEEFDKYINYAYNLSQNMKTASYPIYTDGIKDKNDFIKQLMDHLNLNLMKYYFIKKTMK